MKAKKKITAQVYLVVRLRRWGKSPPVIMATLLAVCPAGCKIMYIGVLKLPA